KTGLWRGDANQHAGGERAAQIAGRQGNHSSVHWNSLRRGKAPFAVANKKIDRRPAFGRHRHVQMPVAVEISRRYEIRAGRHREGERLRVERGGKLAAANRLK